MENLLISSARRAKDREQLEERVTRRTVLWLVFVWFCTGGRAVLGHVIEVGAVGDVTEVGAQLLGLYEIEDAWASAAAGAGGSSCSRL